MNIGPSKSFFLISFLPAIAYWYLEEYYPIRIAVAGGLALAVLEIILEKVFTKHVHTLSKFNFILIALLGGISLLGEDGLWFKLQPFFTGFIMGGFLLYKLKKGEGLFLEMMKEMNGNKVPPVDLIKTLETHLAYFLMVYGCLMGALALWGTTSQWAFFKTIGFYIAFIVFFLFEVLMLRRKKTQYPNIKTGEENSESTDPNSL
ncbi:MAG: inner membrane-spanning protein YciB [Bacteriovoracaceae bacterium]